MMTKSRAGWWCVTALSVVLGASSESLASPFTFKVKTSVPRQPVAPSQQPGRPPAAPMQPSPQPSATQQPPPAQPPPSGRPPAAPMWDGKSGVAQARDPVPVLPRGRKGPARMEMLGFEIGMTPEEVAGVAQAGGYQIHYSRSPSPQGPQIAPELLGAEITFQKGNESNTIDVSFSSPPLTVVQIARHSRYQEGILASAVKDGVGQKFGAKPVNQSEMSSLWAWTSSGSPSTTRIPSGGEPCGSKRFLAPRTSAGSDIDSDAWNKQMRARGWGSCATLRYHPDDHGIVRDFSVTVVDIDAIMKRNDRLLAEGAAADASKKQQARDKAKQDKPTF
jgi:hypothetical protein